MSQNTTLILMSALILTMRTQVFGLGNIFQNREYQKLVLKHL